MPSLNEPSAYCVHVLPSLKHIYWNASANSEYLGESRRQCLEEKRSQLTAAAIWRRSTGKVVYEYHGTSWLAFVVLCEIAYRQPWFSHIRSGAITLHAVIQHHEVKGSKIVGG
jgi:hypothetical protein